MAPNPPFKLDTRDLKPYELMQSMLTQNGHQFDLGQFEAGSLYSYEYAFMRGHVQGQLLGIPLVEMELRAQPPQPDGEWGYFHASATVPTDSWFALFADEV